MTKPNSIEKPDTAAVTTTNQFSSTKAAWQKPRIQQLRISLDTAFGSGSNTDGLGGSIPPV